MADPKLRKVALTVFKDKTVSDAAQIPASGVDITFHKRGAISDRTQNLTAGAGRTLNVRDSKGLVVNDVLQFETDDTITATVTAKPSDASATVTVAGGTLALVANDRLVIVGPAGRVPTIYTDPLGVTSTASLTTDSTGYAQAYLKERQADVLIGMNSGSITPQFREAETSGDDEFGLVVTNFDDLQDAIDSLPSVLGDNGGTIFLPAGLYAITSTINVNRSCKIKGEGVGATVLYWLNATKDVDCFEVSDSYVSIEDLSIKNVESPYDAGTGRGIVYASASPMTGHTLRNVAINYSPSWGVYFDAGENGNSYISHTLFERVHVQFPQSGGAVYLGADTFVTKIDQCNLDMNDASAAGYALHAKNPTNLRVSNCEIAPATNTVGILLEEDASGLGQGGPLGVTINDCDIETAGGSTAYAIHIQEGKNVTLSGNYIYQFANGVHFEDCTTPTTINNNFRDIDTTDILYTDCVKPLSLNDYSSGGTTAETAAPVTISEAGSTAGTILVANGVVQVPRYATGSLPAGAAGQVLPGSLAYDTTTNSLKVLRNDGTTWANVP